MTSVAGTGIHGLLKNLLGDIRTRWRHGMVRNALALAFGLIALGGVAFVAWAAYTALRQALMPWWAGLITGGSLLAVAVIGIWALFRTQGGGREEHPPAEPAAAQNTPPVDAARRLGQGLGASLRQREVRTTDVVIAALVAGTVLGANPALRERLINARSAKASSRRHRTRSG